MKDIDSLAHTKWRCQYHIVFVPKYRNQLQKDKLYEQISMKEYIDPFTGEPVKESK